MYNNVNSAYQQLIPRFRDVVCRALPPGSTVIVVSKGDDDLLDLNGRAGWHFPQREDGVYAGHYPRDSATAIDDVESLREKGGEFLVFPQTSFWWLDHYKYAGFREHLERRYRLIAHDEQTCLIYDLRGSNARNHNKHKGNSRPARSPHVARLAQSDVGTFLRESRNHHALRLIRESGIFNLDFYSRQTETIFDTVEDGIKHYLHRGWKERLNPHPLFDTRFYLETYDDIASENINPLVHYIESGNRQSRDPHPLFDTEHYLGQDARLRAIATNALSHYVRSNHQESPYNPNPLFNTRAYLELNPDVRALPTICALEHYIVSGRNERRSVGNPLHALLDNVAYPSAERLERGNWRYGRVWVALQDASRTGAPLIGLNIIKHLANHYRYDCLIVLGHGGPLEQELKEYGTVVNLDDMWKVASRASATRMLLYSLLDEQPLFGICNSAETNFLMDAFHKLHVPFLSLVHEFADYYPEKIAKTIHAQAEKVIYPAPVVKASHVQKIGCESDKMLVIPQGVFDPDFPKGDKNAARISIREELGLAADTFIFLGSGYVDLRKGCDHFLAIAREFFASHPTANCAFVWLGDLDSKYATNNFKFWLLEDVKMSGLEGKVQFIGAREGHEVDKYFLGSDAFLMVSRHDPFPCVVLEAMAAGLPIICYDSKIGSTEILRNDAGIIVPFLDIHTAAKKAYELFKSARLRRDLGAKAADLVRRNFQYSDYVEKLVSTTREGKATSERTVRTTRKTGSKGKIFFPHDNWNISGVNTAMETVGNWLVRHGWEFEILFTVPESDIDFTRLGRPTVPYRFLFGAECPWPVKWRKLIGYLETHSPCVMFCGYDYQTNAIAPALSNKIAVVAWNQADGMEYYEQVHRLGRYFNAQVCVSRSIAEEVGRMNPALASRSTVIPNTSVSRRDIFDGRKSVRNGPIRLVYTGRIAQYQKRVMDFAELANALEQEKVNFQMRLIGDGPDSSKLASAVSRFVKDGSIILPGAMTKRDVLTQLEEAHLFILLSDFEGLPLSVIEAMAKGCVPMVPAISSGIPELVQHGQNGFVMEGRDYSVWARAIKELTANREQFRAMSRAAAETIRQHYTIEHIGSEWDGLFQRLLDEIEQGKYSRPEVLKWKNPFGDVLPPTYKLSCPVGSLYGNV